jgi:hypothetical protein
MCDKDDCFVALISDTQQLFLKHELILRIQRRERLIHQQDSWIVCERPDNRDALAHATRLLMRIVVGKSAKPRPVGVMTHDFIHDLFFDPPHPQTVCGILPHGEPWENGVSLKDRRINWLRTARDRFHVDGATGDTFQSGQDTEKRCLPTARGADDRQEFTAPTSNETLSSTRSFPKHLTRFRICMAGRAPSLAESTRRTGM